MIKRQRRKGSKMTSKKVKDIVKKTLVNEAEKKRFVTSQDLDGSTDVTLGTVLEFSPSGTDIFDPIVPKGLDEDERVGDEITLQSWKLKLTDYTSDSVYRMLIVQFPDGDAGEYLTALNGVGSTKAVNGFLPRKEDYPPRYTVLYNKVHKFDLDQDLRKIRSINLKVRGLKMEYSLAGSRAIRGNVKLYVITNSSQFGGVIGDFQIHSKMIYTDM